MEEEKMPKIKPKGYWKEWRNIEKEINKVITKIGHFPTQSEMKKEIGCTIPSAIFNYHGGLENVTGRMGYKQIRKPINYWKNKENALKEVREIMKKHSFDKLPGSDILHRLGYYSLPSAIYKHYRGFKRFRKLLGEEQTKSDYILLNNKKSVVKRAKEIMKKHDFDTIPGTDILIKLGYPSFACAIYKNYKSMSDFRNDLGEKNNRRANGKWRDLDYTIEQAKKLMKDNNLTALPCYEKFRELGYSSLLNAISRYHGGRPTFRETLNQFLGIKSESKRLEEFLETYSGGKDA
jgi:hypothetical protein